MPVTLHTALHKLGKGFPMHRTKMTEEGVKRYKLKAPVRQERIFDTVCKGLVLLVSYGGSKRWLALHYVNGKPRYHTLGHYPRNDSDKQGLRLKQAREKAEA